MARFVRFSPCPKCGSRNNLGMYDDGSAWCFGCHYYEKRSADKFVPKADEDEEVDIQGDSFGKELNDFSPGEVLTNVLGSTRITVPELLRAGAKSTTTDTLAFTYYTPEGTPTCIQVRDYNSNRKAGAKYLNRGSTEHAFPLYHYHPDDRRVVITEDTLSALKVARVTNSFSALGTHIQTHKLVQLRSRGFQTVFVWLDKDKWREGREICEKAQWIGLSARAIISDLDPKYYSETEILTYISKPCLTS